MLLVKVNRKPYMGNPIVSYAFYLSDLESSMSRPLTFLKLMPRG